MSIAGLPMLACAELRRTHFQQQALRRTSVSDIPLSDTEGDLPPVNHATAVARPAPLVAGLYDTGMPDEMLPTPPEAVPVQRSSLAQKQFTMHYYHLDHLKPKPSLLRLTNRAKLNRTRKHKEVSVVTEYDLVDDGPGNAGVHVSSGRVVDGEQQTAEDLERIRLGEVDHVMLRKPQATVVTHPQQSVVQSEVKVEKHTEAKDKGGQKQMKSQCMAFAEYLRAQDVFGPELVRMWQGTCVPALKAGEANPAYTKMCDAIPGALDKYVGKKKWPTDKVCDAVLRIFNEAGVGV